MIAAASKAVPRRQVGATGERHQSCLLTGKMWRAMNVEASRQAHVRNTLSPPGRGHAPGKRLGWASDRRKGRKATSQQTAIRSLASATGGSADNIVSSQTGSCPGTPFPSQSRQGVPRSPTPTSLGPPPTLILPMGRSIYL